jgi:hypothetical protein
VVTPRQRLPRHFGHHGRRVRRPGHVVPGRRRPPGQAGVLRARFRLDPRTGLEPVPRPVRAAPLHRRYARVDRHCRRSGIPDRPGDGDCLGISGSGSDSTDPVHHGGVAGGSAECRLWTLGTDRPCSYIPRYRRAVPDLVTRVDRAVQRTQQRYQPVAGRCDSLHHDPPDHGGHLPRRPDRGTGGAGGRGHGSRSDPLAGPRQGCPSRGPNGHPWRIHPGYWPSTRGDGGGRHGDRELSVHRPFAQVVSRHHPVVDREQLRRVDRP